MTGCRFSQAAALGLLTFLVGCASLPEDVHRPASTAFMAPESTALGRTLAPVRAGRSGQTGFVLLDTGRDAFTHRANLIEGAGRAIDAQYYIWNADGSGRDLAARMLAAADRGVKVRVLLDDFGIGTKDEQLYALDTHADIEIRLYNPLPPSMRTGMRRWIGLLADFDRVAPRMHNKLLLVDGAVAVAGGRNIGDEYFDLSPDRNFRDRDVMFHGDAVPKAGESFDASWNSDGAYPIASVTSVTLSDTEAESIQDRLRDLRNRGESPLPVAESSDAAHAALAAAFADAVWARAELHYNRPPPPGVTPSFDNAGDIATRLVSLMRNTERTLLIESGYLISGEAALGTYRDLAERGVRVQVLTNSLETNDVLPLHAGYTRSREDVVRSGVELHELRPDAASCLELIGSADACAPNGRLALHAKSIVFDDAIVYIGSFNMNPRSAFLNTETAVIVHSEALARRVANDIRANLAPENSWRVAIDAGDALEWRGAEDGEPFATTSEPSSSLGRSAGSCFYSLIPMENYL